MLKKIIIIFLAGMATVFSSCNKGKNTENADEKSVINKAFLENVKTVKPTLSNQEQELTLSGKVEFDPAKMVNYTSLISGLIERTYFSLGDKVQKGQTMLDIRSSELSSLQSELAIARRSVQSAESMYKDNLISEKELLEARSTYAKLQADLSLYGENKGGGVFAVKSPMAGFVVAKNASSGSTVSAGDAPLFTVADLSNVWITVNVYAGNLRFVKQGMPVEITTLAYPDEVFSGKIDALSQVFDPEEKVLKARIVMPNKDLKFKPEMSVVVKLCVGAGLAPAHYGNTISIPSDALIFDDNKYFVVVATLRGDWGAFEIREIQLQGHYQRNSYIRSGLTENDEVVVKNQLLIYSELKGK